MFPYLIAGAIGYAVAKIFESDETPKYADGGSILLAPNGKPSNLTPEQYKLVRTPAFKQWFGDWENDSVNSSKVVDFNGEPLVCYHGTLFDFNIFERTIFGKFGKGMYFTSYIDSARKYAKNYENSRIIPVFLKSINLFKTEELFKDQIKNLPKNYDGIWSSLVWGNDYDYNEIDEDEIIVYSPEQIKLADGTNTTFDNNNPDIRYAGGGEVSKNVDSKLKELGFVFNNSNYRYGKTIDEQDYITAFYDKTKGLYKIRGTHKFKTPLGGNSVGIQFDFDNEKEFYNKINEYLLRIQ